MIPSVDLLEPRHRWMMRWLGAATLISAIHIGGGTLAMMYGLEEFVEEAPGAIVVEIAPVATTLESDITALLGRLSSEREATQAASTPKTKKVEEEAKEDLPSLATEPEVALPKPTPVEDKPKEEPKEETSPQVRVAQEQVAATKAMAPLRVDAQIAAKSAAPDAGTAAINARSMAFWQNSVLLQINKHRRYPTTARRDNMQGDVHVRVLMDRSGQLMSPPEVVRSSGFAVLDEEALAIVKRASPLPGLPATLKDETMDLTIPIKFRITK
jgi:periplasmic protein TonB